ISLKLKNKTNQLKDLSEKHAYSDPSSNGGYGSGARGSQAGNRRTKQGLRIAEFWAGCQRGTAPHSPAPSLAAVRTSFPYPAYPPFPPVRCRPLTVCLAGRRC